MIIPDFSKNTENETLMYFECDGNEKILMDALEDAYPGFSSMNAVVDNGKKYICLHMSYSDF